MVCGNLPLLPWIVDFFLFVAFGCCCFSIFAHAGGLGIGAFGNEDVTDDRLSRGDESFNGRVLCNVTAPGVGGGVESLRDWEFGV